VTDYSASIVQKVEEFGAFRDLFDPKLPKKSKTFRYKMAQVQHDYYQTFHKNYC
jgi:hypothetical protein